MIMHSGAHIDDRERCGSCKALVDSTEVEKQVLKFRRPSLPYRRLNACADDKASSTLLELRRRRRQARTRHGDFRLHFTIGETPGAVKQPLVNRITGAPAQREKQRHVLLG